MTPEQRTALNRLRDTAVIPALAGAAAKKAAAAAAPPADMRPRFAAGPLKGSLKDRRARMEEELGLTDPGANEWLPEAAQLPEWRAKFDAYQKLFAPAVLDEQKAKKADDDLDAAAKQLGIAPEKFRCAAWRDKNASLIAEADRRVRLREQADALAAELEAPLPAEVEDAAE